MERKYQFHPWNYSCYQHNCGYIIYNISLLQIGITLGRLNNYSEDKVRILGMSQYIQLTTPKNSPTTINPSSSLITIGEQAAFNGFRMICSCIHSPVSLSYCFWLVYFLIEYSPWFSESKWLLCCMEQHNQVFPSIQYKYVLFLSNSMKTRIHFQKSKVCPAL